MPAGRPTKYKKKYCDELIEWFDNPPSEPLYKRTFYSNGVMKSEELIDRPIDFPTFQGFAHYIGVHVDTLNAWCKEHEEFSEAYAHAKMMQEDIWLRESMAGRYNPQFAKFFGINCLNYHDKVEQETKITDFSFRFDDMPDEESDEITG